MTVFVFGGSGSGKSEYAENIIVSEFADKRRYYIATMMSFGEEGAKRVERHRKLRSGKGFFTVECPVNISGCLNEIENPEAAVLLLECIPNLVANEMFTGNNGEEGLVDRVCSGIRYLCENVGNIVIVSDNVFEDGTDYGGETVRYMKYLAEINNRIAEASDRIIEVVVGIPLKIK